MSRVLLFFAAIALPCILARADVIVSTSIDLTGLSIAPASGSVMIMSPVAGSAFAQAQDSLGGFAQQFNTVNDSATSAAAMTALANANASASAPLLTASGGSGVNIGGITASASSGGNGGPGSLVGSFEITGTTGLVSVTLGAPLTGNQSLMTTDGGLLANSEIIFSLLLPDVNSTTPILFYDNPLTIGPDTTMVSPLSTTLSQSLMLMADTPYTFIAEVDAESSGLNMVPEPSLLPLTALGLFGIVSVVRRRLK